VLPLFAGIYKRGAGLGPATAFLYSGPAINVLAIILTARVLGLEIGSARAVGAVAFSLVVGLLMAHLFRSEEAVRQAGVDPFAQAPVDPSGRRPWQDAVFLATMIAVLVFANWGAPNQQVGAFAAIYRLHWWLTLAGLAALGVMMPRWYEREELRRWALATWDFAKQITPLLLAGILVAGWVMGRPGHEGLVPARWVSQWLGGNGLGVNLFAAVVGAFMYFATLTEVPILQTLIGAGMGKGPALTLLLAGPALSLPSMLVIRSYLGTRKTLTYAGLVVAMATLTGWLYGALA